MRRRGSSASDGRWRSDGGGRGQGGAAGRRASGARAAIDPASRGWTQGARRFAPGRGGQAATPEQLTALLTPSLQAMGYEVVRVIVSGRINPVLQVMIERADRQGMTVEDCAEASHAISALLDVEDPFPGAYTLEVSSPGIDRPLTRPDDFTRFAGFAARIEVAVPIDGRKRFKGRLLGLDEAGTAVRIALDAEAAPAAGDDHAPRVDGVDQVSEEGGVAELPLRQIVKAKLVLTDDLIAAHQTDEAIMAEGGSVPADGGPADGGLADASQEHG